MFTVRGIVRDYLIKNGYDGLYGPFECGCSIGHLMCCAQVDPDCLPGIYVEGTTDTDDYMIGPKKPE